jgi:hypothetical protein
MKRLMTLALLVCASMAFSQDNSNIHALRVYNPNQPTNFGCNGNPCDINYNGGPVFEKAPTVYIIWYGNWSAKDKSIIDYYFEHLGGTTQEKINTTYSDSSNKSIPNALNHSASDDYHDNYSLGKSLSGDSEIQKIVANAIKAKHLPNDTNGIYFVLTYKDVTDSGFCSQFCGYHGPSQSIVSGETIKYSMVGDPDQCPSGCETSVVLGDHGTGGSPNKDPGADGATAIMWHEFSESSSDPEVNLQTAWAGNFCGESGDCCAWLFGKVKTDKNGNYYTNTVGKKNYAMQMMLELTSTSRSGNVPAECENVYQKP